MSLKVVGIIGNPNSGKSTVFNLLTKQKQKISNWPGVTVARKSGNFSHGHDKFALVDLPGIYSLGIGKHTSIDQKITIDFLKEEKVDLIINVLDSTNLQRHLYLTIQLLEMGIPVLIILNMDDLAKKEGIDFDLIALKKYLGCEVIRFSAKNAKSTTVLKNGVKKILENRYENNIIFDKYPEVIKQAVQSIKKDITIKDNLKIIRALEGDGSIIQNYDKIDRYKLKIKETTNESVEYVLVNSRYQIVNSILEKFVNLKSVKQKGIISDKVDKILMNNYFGLPIFFFIMYLIFSVSVFFGDTFQDFFTVLAQAIFIKAPLILNESIGNLSWVNNIIIGIGGGVQTVLSFVPIIFSVYLLLAFIEDVGYTARISYIADRVFSFIGLSGKAVLPLIIGFGCNVPSITASRILTGKKERIITILMAPFISCSARFSVYIVFASIFFANNLQNVIFSLYVFGILSAILTGFIASKLIFRQKSAPLLIELPSYKIPSLSNILLSSWRKVREFVFSAGKLIVIVYFIIYLISSINLNFSFIDRSDESSILDHVGKKITYIFKPMGIKENNWPASVGLISGIFAKEVIIGTIIPLYASLGGERISEVEENHAFFELIKMAFISIPKNFTSYFKGALSFYDASDVIEKRVLDENNIDNALKKTISKYFDSWYSVVSYLIFILLYFPCISVFGAIVNEIGLRWAFISISWSTSYAYLIACIFYQTCNFIIK